MAIIYLIEFEKNNINIILEIEVKWHVKKTKWNIFEKHISSYHNKKKSKAEFTILTLMSNIMERNSYK